MEQSSFTSPSPESTFEIGQRIGSALEGGEVILLTGDLGAGKTTFTKGVLDALDFDADEVSSPSFSLVNLYRTPGFDVYHIDLWRIDEAARPADAIGLQDILEDSDAVIIIEWSEKLRGFEFTGRKVIRIEMAGSGDETREITSKTADSVM